MSNETKNLEEIRKLTADEARRRVEGLIAEGKLRATESSASTTSVLEGLPAEVKALFERWERVATAAGEAMLERSEIGPSRWRSGFIRIGSDFDDAEVVVGSGESAVYVLDGSEPAGEHLESLPTVYHWLLSVA